MRCEGRFQAHTLEVGGVVKEYCLAYLCTRATPLTQLTSTPAHEHVHGPKPIPSRTHVHAMFQGVTEYEGELDRDSLVLFEQAGYRRSVGGGYKDSW